MEIHLQERIAAIARSVLEGRPSDRSQAEDLAGIQGDDLYDLFYWANKIRISFVGREVKFCAIVAAKVGGCSEDCKFCAQSAHYHGPATQLAKLTEEQILASARHAAEAGADSFGIVNSGRAPTRQELENWLKPILQKIAAEGKTRACVSLGTLTPEAARFLYDCGVRRIHHNIETSERHFPKIISTHTYAERIQTLKVAREAGLSVCSGGVFGMGEDWTDRLDMMFALREAGVDVMPINFLNAIPGTPLENQPPLHPMECLKIIALARFILHDKELKVCGGREKVLRDLQSWIFFAGASSMMIGNYLTTSGRPPEADHEMVRGLGLGWKMYGA
jgi:biotin synthase